MLSMKKYNHLFTLLLVFIVQITFAQTKTITGTVTDEDGIPLPGVNITVEGTSTGTTTDFDGEYEIDAEQGQTLVFSYVGFGDEKMQVGDTDVIDVTMKAGTSLDEVVITAFGRKMTRNEMTASVVTVGSDEIVKSPFTSATAALQGKVAGLVTNSTSGAAGSMNEIRIRGMNSLTADNSPLFVVDGVPVNSGSVSGGDAISSLDIFSLINPADIESVSVLKDAAAVAPYGAEGTNGVILITTKSGKEGAPTYNLSYKTGIKNEATKGLKMMNATQRL